MKDLSEVFKKRDFNIPQVLFENYKKLKLTDFELIVLIYYINDFDKVYNPDKVSKFLGVDKIKIIEVVDSLQSKNFISIVIEKEDNISSEKINLDNLYKKLAINYNQADEEVNDKTIFNIFEEEFGRTLSPTEFEIINSWIDLKVNQDLIIGALKESVFNGVRSLKYVDAILNEWEKKGVKKLSDVKKENDKIPDKTLFEYDWLNDKE